ncbi:hypothetical protein HZZ00_37965 (plasmid) [Streptomyces sp. NEAU-sy36]|uniref:hypothetical protein n=1 Tax=unclassified Streptomyces TaxID=2593676 RepID=UPI0015D58370|nr:MULTISPECIES: hypothetical protein [unclassified Streptomyces]QLJ06818.1 hypothetical protein HZZ00_37965 [Streptomyces sp. NEAU-sy36]
MNEAWGTVVAAVAAGVFGIGGILAGIYVGRRQTAYQATVEHQQWLRGQRQQAFATFLEAWDCAYQRIQDILEGLDEHTFPGNFHPQNYEAEMAENMDRLLAEAVAPIQKPYEQLMLIVPDEVVGLVEQAVGQLRRMSDRLRAWALCGSGAEINSVRRDEYWAADREAAPAREKLFQASREVLLSPPAPAG